MKKALFLLLAIMLCMSLCACGGMAGEKAAELYPDIVGEWGTDPFGEEFVLTLSKDGSCTVLDTVGTWTLDSKQSNEEYVVLTVKTENVSYYVKLDRVQPDRRYMYDSVNLVIMDAKQEIPVYEGFVFTQGDHFVSPELALHAVPELIGEWGSHYWAEESVLTVREDGTCTVLRQPGKWCLVTEQSTWPGLHMRVKLESGIHYEIFFELDNHFDWGYPRAHMYIHNLSEESPAENDPMAENEQFHGLVNREQVIRPMEAASIIVGEWSEGENKKSFATFREDGTCTIRGADGLWTLDYTAFYIEKYRNGWDYCLHAKISGDEYDICFSDLGSGNYHMYILNQDDDIYILESSNVVKINAE